MVCFLSFKNWASSFVSFSNDFWKYENVGDIVMKLLFTNGFSILQKYPANFLQFPQAKLIFWTKNGQREVVSNFSASARQLIAGIPENPTIVNGIYSLVEEHFLEPDKTSAVTHFFSFERLQNWLPVKNVGTYYTERRGGTAIFSVERSTY